MYFYNLKRTFQIDFQACGVVESIDYINREIRRNQQGKKFIFVRGDGRFNQSPVSIFQANAMKAKRITPNPTAPTSSEVIHHAGDTENSLISLTSCVSVAFHFASSLLKPGQLKFGKSFGGYVYFVRPSSDVYCYSDYVSGKENSEAEFLVRNHILAKDIVACCHYNCFTKMVSDIHILQNLNQSDQKDILARMQFGKFYDQLKFEQKQQCILGQYNLRNAKDFYANYSNGRFQPKKNTLASICQDIKRDIEEKCIDGVWKNCWSYYKISFNTTNLHQENEFYGCVPKGVALIYQIVSQHVCSNESLRKILKIAQGRLGKRGRFIINARSKQSQQFYAAIKSLCQNFFKVL